MSKYSWGLEVNSPKDLHGRRLVTKILMRGCAGVEANLNGSKNVKEIEQKQIVLQSILFLNLVLMAKYW